MWVVRACPLCSGALIVGWQRGLRLGFGEVCGPTGQQVAATSTMMIMVTTPVSVVT